MSKILTWAVMTSQGGGKGETGPDCASGAFLTSYTSYSLSNLHLICQKFKMYLSKNTKWPPDLIHILFPIKLALVRR